MYKYFLSFLIIILFIVFLLLGLELAPFDNTSQIFFILGLLTVVLLIILCVSYVPKFLYRYQIYVNSKLYEKTMEDCNIYYNDESIILCSCHSTVKGFQGAGAPMTRLDRSTDSQMLGNYVLEYLAASKIVNEDELDAGYKELLALSECQDERVLTKNWNFISATRDVKKNKKKLIDILPYQKATEGYGYRADKDQRSKKSRTPSEPEAVGSVILNILKQQEKF